MIFEDGKNVLEIQKTNLERVFQRNGWMARWLVTYPSQRRGCEEYGWEERLFLYFVLFA